MALLRDHLHYYTEVFSIEGFIADPTAVFGFQDCCFHRRISTGQKMQRWYKFLLSRIMPAGRKGKSVFHSADLEVPDYMRFKTLKEILEKRGVKNVRTVDLYDKRADIAADMNNPLDDSYREAFATVIDVGSTEHVFDTKTCLHNLFKMCKVGGHLFMHIPCNGYFNHGLHTFNPYMMRDALEMNGFRIKYLKYSTSDGIEIEHPDMVCDTIMWVVGQKMEHKPLFVVPQQQSWGGYYNRGVGLR